MGDEIKGSRGGMEGRTGEELAPVQPPSFKILKLPLSLP